MTRLAFVVATAGLLSACGGHPAPLQAHATSTPTLVDAASFASSEEARLMADFSCKCGGADHRVAGDACQGEIVLPYVESDHTFQAPVLPSAMNHDDADPDVTDMLKSCWRHVSEWESHRALQCLKMEPQTDLGLRPSCGPAPQLAVASVDAWWTQPHACLPGETLQTFVNPADHTKLLGAICTTTGTNDATGASQAEVGSRRTTWYFSGSVKSDATRSSNREWYPHGKPARRATQLDAATGAYASDRYYINGVVADHSERGVYAGFRRDGGKLYESNNGTYVTWFGRDGQPAPKDAALKALAGERASETGESVSEAAD